MSCAGLRRAAIRGGLLAMGALLAWPSVAALVLEPGQTISFAGGRFSVGSPPGWVLERARSSVTMSRDGIPLNVIEARLHEPRSGERALSRRARTGDLHVEEVAARYLARLTTQGDASDVEVTELSATELAGSTAFRLRLSYRLGSRLAPVRFSETAVGTWTPEGLLVIRYFAPQVYYFPQRLDDFEATIPSLSVHQRRH